MASTELLLGGASGSEVDPDGYVQDHDSTETGNEASQQVPVPSYTQITLLFICGIGTFARTEVFVIQTRFFTVCGGYGDDYFPLSHAAFFIPPIFFLYLETKLGPALTVMCGSKLYARLRVVCATLTSVAVLVVLAVMLSSPHMDNPATWGLYVGLVVLGWGASATYDSVTTMLSALHPSCFAAYFVGTYSAALIFGPINLATGMLCRDGETQTRAVASQLAASIFLVFLVIVCFVYVTSLPEPTKQYHKADTAVGRILSANHSSVDSNEPVKLSDARRQQLKEWIGNQNMEADPWINIAEMHGITPRAWESLRRQYSDVAGESSADGYGGAGAADDAPVHNDNHNRKMSLTDAMVNCWQPALGLLVNTLINIVVTGLYIQLGAVADSLFYEFFLGTAVGATLTLSNALKAVSTHSVLVGVAMRCIFVGIIAGAVYSPDEFDKAVLHALNVPWAILGGWCYTMTFIKSACIAGGNRIMPIVYFAGMSGGIIIVLGLNQHP